MEKWTLPVECEGDGCAAGSSSKSPVTMLAQDAGPRCVWTSRRSVKRSRRDGVGQRDDRECSILTRTARVVFERSSIVRISDA